MANRNQVAPETGEQGVPNGEQQGTPTPTPPVKPLEGLTDEVWRKACSDAGFMMNSDRQPVIPVSGDKGSTLGFLVSIPTPRDIDPENLARAILGHCLRTGQSAIKAKGKTPSLELATQGARSASNGSYSPARTRDKDIAQKEAERRFDEMIRLKVLEQQPEAKPDTIARNQKRYAETEAGIAKIKEFRDAVLAEGTYQISKEVDASTGELLELQL